jgi:hypothetical protein
MYVAPPALAQVVAKLVAEESPIHRDEAQRVIASFYETRASKSLLEVFEQALVLAMREGTVVQRGDFLWHADMHNTVRMHVEYQMGRGRDIPYDVFIPVPDGHAAEAQILVQRMQTSLIKSV